MTVGRVTPPLPRPDAVVASRRDVLSYAAGDLAKLVHWASQTTLLCVLFSYFPLFSRWCCVLHFCFQNPNPAEDPVGRRSFRCTRNERGSRPRRTWLTLPSRRPSCSTRCGGSFFFTIDLVATWGAWSSTQDGQHLSNFSYLSISPRLRHTQYGRRSGREVPPRNSETRSRRGSRRCGHHKVPLCVSCRKSKSPHTHTQLPRLKYLCLCYATQCSATHVTLPSPAVPRCPLKLGCHAAAHTKSLAAPTRGALFASLRTVSPLDWPCFVRTLHTTGAQEIAR